MRRYLLALIVAIPAAIVALLWTSPPVTAQPVPPPGLRVCTTDSTLTGNCTVASPLGVDIPGTGSPCVAGTAVDNITSDGTASCGATVGTGDIEGVTTSGILTGGCTSGTCSLDTSITGPTILGRTSGTGATSQLTGTQATTLLDTFSTSGTTKGLVSGSSSASTACLKGNNTWGPCGGSRATATWSGAVNNYSVTSTTDVIEVNLTGDATLSGLDSCSLAGDTVDIVYTHASSSGYTLTIANLSSSSTLGNRFFYDGGNVVLQRGSGVHLRCAAVAGADVTNGNYWIVTVPPVSGGTIDGSGTANKVAKWSDSDTLADSSISDNGSTVSTALPFTSAGLITAANGASNGFAIDSDVTIAYDTGSSELDITANGQSFGLGASGKFQTTTDILGGGDISATGAIGGASISTAGNAAFGDDASDTFAVAATSTFTGPTTVGSLNYTPQLESATSVTELTLDADASVVYFDGGSTALGGMTGGVDGRVVAICNISASDNSITVSHENVSATLSSRFQNAGGGSQYIKSRSCNGARYIGSASRWQLDEDGTLGSLQVVGSSSVAAITASGTATLNGNTTLGNADTDVTTIRLPKDDGTPPTLSSCGTSPSVTGGSWAFTITTGSGGSPSCTATFASTKTNTPTCVVTGQGASDYNLSAVSATAITVTNGAGSIGAGSKIHVICIGDA